MCYFPDHSTLFGLKIYDREGALVFENEKSWVDSHCECMETVLQEGERIVGFKSHIKKKNTEPGTVHFSLLLAKDLNLQQ